MLHRRSDCCCQLAVEHSPSNAMQAQVAKHQQEAQLVKEGKLDAEELRAR